MSTFSLRCGSDGRYHACLGPDAHRGTGCNLEARNSLIHFSQPDTRATQVFETSSSAHLQPIRGTKDSSWEYTRFKGQQVFIMQKTPGADCAIKRSGGVSFAGFKDDVGTCAPVTFGTTQASLERAGWSFSFTDTDSSDTSLAKKCDEDAVNKGWWGRSNGKEYPQGEGAKEVGVASFTMKGKGTAQLHFGNCGPGGETNVYINKKLVTQASSKKEYIFTFDFVDGDLLELKDEGGNAVVKIISLKITCASVIYYRWDPRLRLLDNTLAEPAQIPSDTESSCPNVARTFLNRDSCQRRDSGTCAPPVFQRGKMLTLDEATIKAFYSEGNRYVHRIADLRLEDDYVCTSLCM